MGAFDDLIPQQKGTTHAAPASSGSGAFADLIPSKSAPAQQSDSYLPQGVDDLKRKFVHGASFGLYDDALAATRATLGGVNDLMHGKLGGARDRYAHEKALVDAKERSATENTGAAGTAAELAGGLLSGGGAGKIIGTGLKGAGVASPLIQDAISGAATGGVSSVGEGGDFTTGAAVGGGLGAAGNVIGRGLGKATEFFRKPNVPSIDDVAAIKSAAYKEFENGGGYNPEIYDALKTNMEGALNKPGMGYFAPMHSKTASVLDALEQMKTAAPGDPAPIAPEMLQNLRVLAGDAIRGGEGRTGFAIRNAFDDTLLNPPVGAARGEGMGDALQRANKANQTLQKAELMQNLLSKAERDAANTGSGGNINNKVRQSLERGMTKRKDWSADELAAFESANQPSMTENLLRRVGKMAPGGNGLMQTANVAAIASNPLWAFGSAAAQGAKTLADNASRRRGQQVVETILNGGKKPEIPMSALRRAIESNGGGLGGVLGAIAPTGGAPSTVNVTPESQEAFINRARLYGGR
jgi:hypothetical protein